MRRLLAVALVLEVLGGAYLYNLAQARLGALFEEEARSVSAAVGATIEGLRMAEQVLHLNLLERRDLMETFWRGLEAEGAERDAWRGRLYRQAHPIYAGLSRHGVRELTFFDAEGRSWLRFNRPDRAGEPVRQLRPSIDRALETGTPVSSLEPGLYFHGLRHVSPIRREGRTIGLLETGISFRTISALLRSSFPEHRLAVLLDRGVALNALDPTERSVYPDSALGPAYLVERVGVRLPGQPEEDDAALDPILAAAGRDAGLFDRLRGGGPEAEGPLVVPLSGGDGVDHLLTFAPLADVDGRVVALLATARATDAVVRIRNASAAEFIVFTMLLFAAMMAANRLRESWRDLDRERAELDAIANTMTEGLYVLDHNDRIRFINESACRILGYPRAELMGAVAHYLFHSHDAQGRRVPLEDCPLFLAVKAGRPYALRDDVFRRADGESIVVEVTSAPIPTSVGTGGGAVVTFTDVTRERRQEEQLRKLSRAVEQSPASVIITDRDGVIEYVNPQFERVSGYSAAEVLGATPRELASGHMPKALYEEMWRTLLAGKEWRGEFCNRRKDGSFYWELASMSPIIDETGAITHFIAVKEDITVRKQHEEELHRRANFDLLTGLPNRVMATERLTAMLAEAAPAGRAVAAMIIDVDHFKRINDTLGHSVGDRFLAALAERLRDGLPGAGLLARLGGDEFLFVLAGADAADPDAMDPDAAAARVLACVGEPFRIDASTLHVDASIGVAVHPQDGDTAELLLKHADTALHAAKTGGRGAVHRFTAEMSDKAQRRLVVEERLRRAVAEGGLDVHYQPLVAASSLQVVGAEALARWTDPVLGPVSPAEFIPVAEDTRLILPLGEWMLRRACAFAAELRALCGRDVAICVNVSTVQLAAGGFDSLVGAALDEAGLPGRCLEIEITESALLAHGPEVMRTLNALKTLGVHLAIDDFGTGYSSMAYLQRFPIDTLKIDQMFMRDAVTRPSAAALARAIIAMAHALGLKVIGEGVETAEQLRFLSVEKCDILQGYHLGRPVPGSAFVQTFLATPEQRGGRLATEAATR